MKILSQTDNVGLGRLSVFRGVRFGKLHCIREQMLPNDAPTTYDILLYSIITVDINVTWIVGRVCNMSRSRPAYVIQPSIAAAIDFGTTCSSCAYSFRETETLDININEKWSETDAKSVPTSVLLDKNWKFVAFGYKAEKEYEKKTLHKEHKDWHLFRRFKMTLHNNKHLGLNTEIEDENGVKARAVTIFGMAIKDIKTQLLATLKRNGHDTTEKHTLWVLTVPAIWTEAAKQFMQEAADMAGIHRDRLKLALEPEAAAIFCKELTAHKAKETRSGDADISLMKAFDPGSKYLVLDLGGGTVDVTIQEVLKPNADLKILDKASGGDWGGVSVDKYFLNFIKKLVGLQAYETFSQDYTYQKLQFEKAMEALKHEATPETSNALNINIPPELKDLYEKSTSQNFDIDIAKQTQFNDDIKIIGNVMEIKQKLIHEFYARTIDNIISHVKKTLKNKSAKGVSSLLLVGGFAESPLVEARIKKAFEGKSIERVIVPRGAGYAVVKGAVIFGHNPNAIAERVSPYTYGVETNCVFDPNKHPRERKINVNGVEKVARVFDKHITINEIMLVGKPNPEHKFYTINPKVDKSCWNVYSTEHPNPTFCDEVGCVKLGTVEIKLEGIDRKNEKRELGFRMTCQGTVLEAEACDKSTGKRLAAKFNFFSEK